jgi:hypothetical protein
MPKPQPSVLKRQREQKKRDKRLLKAEKKAQRQNERRQQTLERSGPPGPSAATEPSNDGPAT